MFERNVRRLLVFTALKGFGFGLFAAMWVVYLQRARGFSLSGAAIVDVSFFVAVALGEIPTGIAADTFGRKTSLAIGMVTMGVAALGWVLAPSLPLVVVCYALLGLGYTFVSGADDALFYESVHRAGRGDEYARLLGRQEAIFTGALGLGSVASGLLGSASLRLPFFVAVASNLVALAVVLSLREPARSVVAAKAAPLAAALGLLRARASLRRLVALLALVPVAAFVLETLMSQPQAIALGVPVAGIGVVVMALQLAEMTGSLGARWLGERVASAVPASVGAIVAGLVALFVVPGPAALGLFAVVTFATGVFRPLVLTQLHAEVPDHVRATVLSAQSLLTTATAAMVEPVVGFASDRGGFAPAYLVLAGVVVLTAVAVGRSRPCAEPAMVSA